MDFILEGVNKYLMARAKEQIKLQDTDCCSSWGCTLNGITDRYNDMFTVYVYTLKVYTN